MCVFLVLVAWGVRESSYTNNIFTTLNLITVSTVIVTGFYAGIHFKINTKSYLLNVYGSKFRPITRSYKLICIVESYAKNRSKLKTNYYKNNRVLHKKLGSILINDRLNINLLDKV